MALDPALLGTCFENLLAPSTRRQGDSPQENLAPFNAPGRSSNTTGPGGPAPWPSPEKASRTTRPRLLAGAPSLLARPAASLRTTPRPLRADEHEEASSAAVADLTVLDLAVGRCIPDLRHSIPDPRAPPGSTPATSGGKQSSGTRATGGRTRSWTAKTTRPEKRNLTESTRPSGRTVTPTSAESSI